MSEKQPEKEIEPWASVIMPTFNGESYLASALDSVLCQSGPELEVIIVDDGSSDGTKEIIKSYEQRLNLKVFYREHVGSWVANTNFAISKARGKFVSLLHQDDIWEPERISRLSKLVEKYPAAVLYLHPSMFIDANNLAIGEWNCPFPKETCLLKSEYILPRLFVQNFVSIPAPLIRRTILKGADSMDEKLWFTADWKLWLNCAQAGDWAYCPEKLSKFRVHSESQTVRGAKYLKDYREQHTYVQDEFKALVEGDRAMLKIAAYSTEVNTALAAFLNKNRVPLLQAVVKGFLLGPWKLVKFFNYSRISERLLPRVRLHLRECWSDTELPSVKSV